MLVFRTSEMRVDQEVVRAAPATVEACIAEASSVSRCASRNNRSGAPPACARGRRSPGTASFRRFLAMCWPHPISDLSTFASRRSCIARAVTTGRTMRVARVHSRVESPLGPLVPPCGMGIGTWMKSSGSMRVSRLALLFSEVPRVARVFDIKTAAILVPRFVRPAAGCHASESRRLSAGARQKPAY
jgi:hypothetical protein